MDEYKSIKIRKECWKRLQEIRIREDIKTVSDVIAKLIENYK